MNARPQSAAPLSSPDTSTSAPAPTRPEAARIADLEAALRARDDFLAIAAHELRSPLNTLALRLAVLERSAAGAADAGLREEIRRVRLSADRYVRRAAILLDVAQLNSGRLQPAPFPVDVRKLVDDVVEAHRDDAEFRGTTLRGCVKHDAIGHWDPHMVEQVLSNLVNNAIKYGEGSPVVLRAAVDGADAVFEVADRGPGIDAAQRAKIFEKFERVVDGSRHRSGYGLGLWIVGSMVSAHGGSIEVESSPGQGALFRVRLPLRQPVGTEANA